MLCDLSILNQFFVFMTNFDLLQQIENTLVELIQKLTFWLIIKNEIQYIVSTFILYLFNKHALAHRHLVYICMITSKTQDNDN